MSQLPLVSGKYALDAHHSGINFKVRHLGLSTVRGRFDTFDASLVVGDSLDDVAVTAEVDLASVDTNNADRDAHLASTDFFNVENNPKMTFASTSIEGNGSEYEMAGDLTINSVTKPVTFDVEFNGVETFPMDGSKHVGFEATTEIKRSDFGIDFNATLGADKVLLGEKVKVELDIQFIAPEG